MATLADFKREYAGLITRVAHAASNWEIGEDRIAEVLRASVESWGGEARGESVGKYLDSLRIEDLALAIACADGIPQAWDQFLPRYRPILYAAARAITGDDSDARTLADSLWAELYGIESRGGRRRSLLTYFHGRSSLATWMRALLAQRHVDAIRAARRFEPLENAPEAASEGDPPDGERPRLLRLFAAALHVALAALAARDRMRLAYYYRDELTLKQIARLMDEHESTVSRKLERTRAELRAQVEEALRKTHRLSDEQIRLCYDHAGEEAQIDLAAALSGAPAQGKAPRPFQA